MTTQRPIENARKPQVKVTCANCRKDKAWSVQMEDNRELTELMVAHFEATGHDDFVTKLV